MSNGRKNSIKKPLILQLAGNDTESLLPLKISINQCKQPYEAICLPGNISTIQLESLEPAIKPRWIPPPGKTITAPPSQVKILRIDNPKTITENKCVLIEKTNCCCSCSQRYPLHQHNLFEQAPQMKTKYVENKVFFNNLPEMNCDRKSAYTILPYMAQNNIGCPCVVKTQPTSQLNCDKCLMNYCRQEDLRQKGLLTTETRLSSPICPYKQALSYINKFNLPNETCNVDNRYQQTSSCKYCQSPNYVQVDNHVYYQPIYPLTSSDDNGIIVKHTDNKEAQTESQSQTDVIDTSKPEDADNESLSEMFSKVIKMIEVQTAKLEESKTRSVLNAEATKELHAYAREINANLNSVRKDILQTLETHARNAQKVIPEPGKKLGMVFQSKNK